MLASGSGFLDGIKLAKSRAQDAHVEAFRRRLGGRAGRLQGVGAGQGATAVAHQIGGVLALSGIVLVAVDWVKAPPTPRLGWPWSLPAHAARHLPGRRCARRSRPPTSCRRGARWPR